jgi:hypothetical protein
LNRSEPGLTVLEDVDIDIYKIQEKWDFGLLHRIFLSFHDVFIAIILGRHDSL